MKIQPGFTTQFRMAENSHSGKMASAVPETMVPETSMPVRADKDAQKSEKTGTDAGNIRNRRTGNTAK